MTEYRKQKEQALATELEAGNVTKERIQEIFQELTWLRQYEHATQEEKYKRECEIGKLIEASDYTPEKGRLYVLELDILREGTGKATLNP